MFMTLKKCHVFKKCVCHFMKCLYNVNKIICVNQKQIFHTFKKVPETVKNALQKICSWHFLKHCLYNVKEYSPSLKKSFVSIEKMSQRVFENV